MTASLELFRWWRRHWNCLRGPTPLYKLAGQSSILRWKTWADSLLLAAFVSEASRSRRLARRTIWSPLMATFTFQITSPVKIFKTGWRSESSLVCAEALRKSRKELNRLCNPKSNRGQASGRPTSVLCLPKTKVTKAISAKRKTIDSDQQPGPNS